MADEVRHFTATIPAGTALATPFTQDIGFSPRNVRTIDWRVPPGPSGQMGWRLTMGGVQVIPVNSDPFVVADGNGGTFVVDGYPDSGAWQVQGYNAGAFPHSVYLVFHLDLIGTPAKPLRLLDPVQLGPLPDISVLTRPPGGVQ